MTSKAAIFAESNSGVFFRALASTFQKWTPSLARQEYQNVSPLLIHPGARFVL